MDSEAVARQPGVVNTTGVAMLALLYVAVAIAVAPTTYFDLLIKYTLQRYSLALPLLAVAGLVGASVLCRPKSPLTFMVEKIRHRGIVAVITVGVFLLGAAAFSTLKHVTPLYVPFFADPIMADIDAMLHFGDPWRIAHAVLPDALGPPLFALYGPVWFIQMVGMVLVAAFTKDNGRRAQYFLSLLLVAVVLGTIVRIAGSSAGPIFYGRVVGDDRFDDLMAALSSTPWGRGMVATSDYLYVSYAHDRSVFGTGIAAMPSLHVAVALLNALFLGAIRVFRVWGWLYFAAILFGSIYFGWHYAVDSYVAILATLAIWISSRSVSGTGRSPSTAWPPCYEPG